MSEALVCPLCAHHRPVHVARVQTTDFWACTRCALHFRDPSAWPDREAERAHYQLHDNRPDDPGYRRFLQPLFDALTERIPTASRGLDFGCGDGPALAAMLREAGHEVAVYDPLFQADPACLRHRYAFITASEVFEHLHRPAETLALLDGLLEANGWLGVMTGTPPVGAEAFAQWHYLRDPTHVLFYPHRTMAWIATRFGWRVDMPARNVTLFHKESG